MEEYICIGIFIVFIAYLLFRFIPIFKEMNEKEKRGYRNSSMGLVPDERKRGDSSLEIKWRSRGYRWHEEWQRWVPNINVWMNEPYWKERGYRWDEEKTKWVKKQY
jgi:hypothetical protein